MHADNTDSLICLNVNMFAQVLLVDYTHEGFDL